MSCGPDAALATLAGSADPFLIGVRHHSPALAVAVPELLDAFAPDVVLLELPAEFAPWLPWLADEATSAPVALAGVAGRDGNLAFYPFADFSPELVALRWAARRGVEVIACDLPLADPAWATPEPPAPATSATPAAATGSVDSNHPSFGRALLAGASGRPGEDMWDRVVEVRAPGSAAEAVRRAALLVGWAMRRDAAGPGGVAGLDLCRERWMRGCLAGLGGRRAAAVVGSFHAAALLDGDLPPAGAAAGDARPEVVTSLVPYTFALLDKRSGYPAGIADPQWQQAVVTAAGDPAAVTRAALSAVTGVCAQVRAAGHPAGPAEAREAVRFATDLARLRGLPAPGRGELVEAMQSVLAHGEVTGRSRIVATAMEHVLVGATRGTIAPGAPRSGLRPAVEHLIASLRLPGPGDEARELRLDPLRTDLDRNRDVVLRQLATCHIPYGESIAVEGAGGADALTTRWQVGWSPGTDAMLDIASVRGVTLAQAAEGVLRERRRGEAHAGTPTAAQVIAGLAAAAECGLRALAAEWLAELLAVAPASASLADLMAALALVDRLRHGHIPGMPAAAAALAGNLPAALEALESAAVRQVDGLAGSTSAGDARALATLARRADRSGTSLRLADCLSRLAGKGTPLIAAAASAVEVLLGLADPGALGTRIASWIDAASTSEGRRHLQDRMTGLLAVAEPLLEAGGGPLDGLLDRVEGLPDAEFLSRLPALRGGFQSVSPAARDRLLAVVASRHGGSATLPGMDAVDADALLLRVLADRAGREALRALGLEPDAAPGPGGSQGPAATAPAHPTAGAAPCPRDLAHELPAIDRWRLLLGREQPRLEATAARLATALDELYGAGLGEGAQADESDRAGRGAPFPSVREWAEELSDLFGPAIREEVLARAAEAGRADVLALLEPATVTPSVELLETVLTLAGGLPEARVARLRPLVARLVAELTRQLATRLRPALAGLSTPRPGYRPGGRLDLPRTLRANLHASRRDDAGRVRLLPERPVFATRARRSLDWRLILVVDVSGSMEASVIWSALTAAILAGVPALTTHFVAFSTEVTDFTDRVDDPLGLLLEVRIGGGTHIAAGLRHARSLVTVPARTLVAVVSDFEDNYSLGELLAEARALAESGVTLLGCASLDDHGRPRYSVSIASQLVACGMPVAALSPVELARWVADQVRG